MFKAITLENFKGVGQRQHLELRPITLLFGPNSAGKSTFIHALHYAREVFLNHNLDADQTISGGEHVRLGGFKNLVHNHDEINNVVSLRFAFDLDVSELDEFDVNWWKLSDHYKPDFSALYKNWIDSQDAKNPSFVCPRWSYPVLDNATEGVPVASGNLINAAVEVSISWDEVNERPFASSLKTFFEDELFCEIQAFQTGVRNIRIDPTISALCKKVELSDSQATEEVSLLESLMVSNDTSLFQEIQRDGESQPQRTKKQTIYSGDVTFFARGDALIEADGLLRLFDEEQVESWNVSEIEHEPFPICDKEIWKGVSGLVLGPYKALRKRFENFRYLGPLRDVPKSNYETPTQTDASRWASGLGAWDVLYRSARTEDEKTLIEINQWMSDPDRLDTKYRIESTEQIIMDQATFQKLQSGVSISTTDVIQNENIFSIYINPVGENDDDLRLRPCDVGTGLSQVLPVVVTTLTGQNNLICIEQPELHLHPRVQAELGDMFIESAVGKRKQLLILETHSEVIPLRLMRRIREHATNVANPEHEVFTRDDMQIIYVRSIAGRTVAESLDVSEAGAMLDPWPDGFFEEGFKERFGA